MVLPWIGFPLGDFIRKCEPTSKAKFVEFMTAHDPKQMPVSSWMKELPEEYGFYANVNPEVDHHRWSQAKEGRIGEFLKRKTLMFNGYAEQVAHMYKRMDLRKFF